MSNNNNYFINPTVMSERVSDAVSKKLNAVGVAAEWEAFTTGENDVGFCSNFSSDLAFSKKTGKVLHSPNKPYYKRGEGFTALYDVMPSAMWLYRLACISKPCVSFDGPEGYKLVWSAAYRHKETGVEILFYEWKGGFTFGARLSDAKEWDTREINKEQVKAILKFLNVLVSPNLTHPYDGVVAGSVA